MPLLGLLLLALLPCFETTSSPLLQAINNQRGQHQLIIDPLAQKEAGDYAKAIFESTQPKSVGFQEAKVDTAKFIDASIALSLEEAKAFDITQHSELLTGGKFIENRIQSKDNFEKVFDFVYEGAGITTAATNSGYILIVVLKRVTRDAFDYLNTVLYPLNKFPVVEDEELSDLLSTGVVLPVAVTEHFEFCSVACVAGKNTRSETILATLIEAMHDHRLQDLEKCFKIGLYLQFNSAGLESNILHILVPKQKFYESALKMLTTCFKKKFEFFRNVEPLLVEFEQKRLDALNTPIVTHASSKCKWRNDNNTFRSVEQLLAEIFLNLPKDEQFTAFIDATPYQETYFIGISFAEPDIKFHLEVGIPFSVSVSIMTQDGPAVYEANLTRLKMGLDPLDFNADVFKYLMEQPKLFNTKETCTSNAPNAVVATRAAVAQLLQNEGNQGSILLNPVYMFVRIVCLPEQGPEQWKVKLHLAHFGFLSLFVPEFTQFKLNEKLTELVTNEVRLERTDNAFLGPEFHLIKPVVSHRTIKKAFEAFATSWAINFISTFNTQKVFGVTVKQQNQLWEVFCLVPSLLGNLISQSNRGASAFTFYPGMAEFTECYKGSAKSAHFEKISATVLTNFDGYVDSEKLKYVRAFSDIKYIDNTKNNSFGVIHRFNKNWEVDLIFWNIKHVKIVQTLNNWRPAGELLTPDPVLSALALEIQNTKKPIKGIKHIVVNITSQDSLVGDLEKSPLAYNTAIEVNSKFFGFSILGNELTIAFESVCGPAMFVLSKLNLDLYPNMNEFSTTRSESNLNASNSLTSSIQLSSSSSTGRRGINFPRMSVRLSNNFFRGSQGPSLGGRSDTNQEMFKEYVYTIPVTQYLTTSQIYEQAARQHLAANVVIEKGKFVAFAHRFRFGAADNPVHNIEVSIFLIEASLYPKTIRHVNEKVRGNQMDWLRQGFTLQRFDAEKFKRYLTFEITDKVQSKGNKNLRESSAVRSEPCVYKQLFDSLQDPKSAFRIATEDKDVEAIGIWHIQTYNIKIVFRKFYDDLFQTILEDNKEIRVDEGLNEKARILASGEDMKLENAEGIDIVFNGKVPFVLGSSRSSLLKQAHSLVVHEEAQMLLDAVRVGFCVLRNDNSDWRAVIISSRLPGNL